LPTGTRPATPSIVWPAILATVLLAGSSACAPAADAPSAAAPTPALAATPLQVPDSMALPPFDRPRQPLVPAGWTMSVWARVPGARLAAWAPDGALLVSRPSAGQVVRLAPGAAGVSASVLLDGLTQPHGLTFAGGTLYVAESDRVEGYRYDAGAAVAPRLVVAGLRDQRSPELGGRYAHALKSVAVDLNGSIYYSVGSTGNISAADRDANPPRAVIMRVRPGGGVRDRSAQRDGVGGGPGRLGVDGGQQPRQHRVPL
jgi:glucose/arabinose dehydrogenase